jgi:adenine-specific DNA-methyltransferase
LKHELAKRLRRDQTDVERKLWYALRNRRFAGFKFRRQQPIGPYVVDLVCFDARLVIELDGSQHGLPENAATDKTRTRWLETQGFRVKRYWNHDMIESFDGVMEDIYRAIDPRPVDR